MTAFGDIEMVFLTDTQLGCYATFSGFSKEQVEEYAERGLVVEPAPAVDGYEWDANQYRTAVEIVNSVRPDLVMIGGDLIDDANSEDQTDAFLEITAQLDDDIDVRWVPGNHDIAPDAEIPTPQSVRRYREVFGVDHYSFTLGNNLIIALNTTVIDHPELVPDEWVRQLDFLTGEVERAAVTDFDNVILIGHHPLFLAHADEEDSYWNLPLERRTVILDLIERANVRIGFAGHWHRNATATDRGFTQVVSGPVGYPLGKDPSGYRTVRVNEGAVEHRYVPLDKSEPSGADRSTR